MFKTLTTKLGNPILINPNHIESINVCEYNETCDIECGAEPESKTHLYCLVRMVSGTKIVVEECKREIMERLS